MYKCCRWCGNFSNGECKSGAIKTAELNLDTFRDDGVINEVLKENLALTDSDLASYYNFAKCLKISKVKATQLIGVINNIISDKQDDIEDALDTAIMNNLGKVEGVYIDNEHEFVCSEFK